jgi:CheY-like chemotaxis protein
MGGQVEVSSVEGQGSVFTFAIELGIAEDTKPADPAAVQAVREVSVLIVDDNATNRRILECLTLGWGMKPVLAENSEAGLEQFHLYSRRGAPFELLLVDCHMPGTDGFGFLEQLRGEARSIDSAIMMLSSSDLQENTARCRELGINRHLMKPVGKADLLDAIQKTLGVTAEVAKQQKLTKTNDEEHGRRLRILVAEDNKVNQHLVLVLLERAGHEVYVVENGHRAIAAWESQKFDAILMDVQMPQMDGLAATSLIRRSELKTGQHIPIIALTAHAMKGDRERCKEAGCDDYLSKPLDRKELLVLLNNLASRDTAVSLQ